MWGYWYNEEENQSRGVFKWPSIFLSRRERNNGLTRSSSFSEIPAREFPWRINAITNCTNNQTLPSEEFPLNKAPLISFATSRQMTNQIWNPKKLKRNFPLLTHCIKLSLLLASKISISFRLSRKAPIRFICTRRSRPRIIMTPSVIMPIYDSQSKDPRVPSKNKLVRSSLVALCI